MALLLLLAVGAVAAWSVMPPPEVAPEVATEVAPEVATEVATAPSCGDADAERRLRFEACLGDGDMEMAATLVESAAASDEAWAFLVLGRWFDPSEESAAPVTKKTASAVQNYKEAVDRGMAEAEPLLRRACDALRNESGLEAKFVVERHCADAQ